MTPALCAASRRNATAYRSMMRRPLQAQVSTRRTLTHGSLPGMERQTVTRSPSQRRSSDPAAATSEPSPYPRVQRDHLGGSHSHVASPRTTRGAREGPAGSGESCGAFVGLAVGPGAIGGTGKYPWSSGIRAFGLLVALDRHEGPSGCPLIGASAGAVEAFKTIASFAPEGPTWLPEQPPTMSIPANASPSVGRMSAGVGRLSPRTPGRRAEGAH